MRRNLLIAALVLIAGILVAVWQLRGAAPGPIRLGFVGGLSGRVADLGVPGRDGALLAVEDANARGGVRGRQVELLVRDDRQDAPTAQLATRELIDGGVAAIIGPMTSSMSMAALEVASTRGVLLMSPTTSTHLLEGKDDWFFRVYPASSSAGEQMAYAVKSRMAVDTIFAVYDLDNSAYVLSMKERFTLGFNTLGGEVLGEASFRSSGDTSFVSLATTMHASKADGFLLLANAMDTAMVCQQLSKLGDQRPMLVGEWSASEELVEYGGEAVERVRVFNTFDRSSSNPRFVRFKARFEERYGYTPGFAATHAYDATDVVIRALEVDGDATALPKTILSMRRFETLQGELQFDPFGDVERAQFLVEVRDGAFRLAEGR